VAGNPANFIRFRFSESVIEELQKIAWWNWPLPKIEEAWPLLLSSDIEAFIAKYQV
jgi:virginiamycin A acetyltransferase